MSSVSRHRQFLSDRIEDAIDVAEHLMVPEAEDAIAVFLDDRGSDGVARGVVMSTIQLDCEPCGAAREIGDEIVDLELADELLALELACAKVAPEAFLGFGLVGAQAACGRRKMLSSQLRTPSPNPLPTGERACCFEPITDA